MENTDLTVLACIDGSRYSTAVCDYAAWISKRSNTSLTLLHNIEHVHNASVSDYSAAIGLGSQEALLQSSLKLRLNAQCKATPMKHSMSTQPKTILT